jgi:hypothetical protein
MDFGKLTELWEEHFKKNDTSLKYSDDFCSWEIKNGRKNDSDRNTEKVADGK